MTLLFAVECSSALGVVVNKINGLSSGGGSIYGGVHTRNQLEAICGDRRLTHTLFIAVSIIL